MARSKRFLLLLFLTLPAAVIASAAVGQVPTPTVACFDAVDHVHSGTGSGYRVVLGVVSVPPLNVYGRGPVETRQKPWPYWEKAGLVIRMGSPPVLVSVPSAWRKRVAITWGSSGTVSTLQFGHCPPPATTWSAYAGGFYLRSPACLPLRISVGGKTAKVWFGLGRRCPAGG
jgi:hypothetical protein